MKKHIKFVAYALAGFMAVSSINVPSVYAEEIPTETVIDTTNNSATDTTTETPTDSTADSSTETPADSTADSSSTSTNKTTTVKKTTAKKQTVKIKKYKKSKKLYVKKATKAYKVTSTGKLKVAKSLKKSAKVTVVGTSTVKKIKYYAIKSGKSTMLVKQSLLSKTKPKTAKTSSKPSTNSSSKPSKSKYNYTYNDRGQKVVTQDNGVPSNAANYAWDDFIRCKMPGVKSHHGDKCVGYKMVNGKKKNIYYNKSDNVCYYIDANGMECNVNHVHMWDGVDWDDGLGFE